MLSIIYFLIAAICIAYDIILIVISPGTFLDNVTSFTHIWSLLGCLLIFFGIYRLKKGHSFWKDCKKWLRIVLITIAGLAAVTAIICLVFIFTPKVNNEPEDCDYVILLGGGIDKNGRLPETVNNKVKVAGDYLLKHKNAFCVVTGGTLKWLPYAEAPEMKRTLVNMGIESEKILIEDQALDTIQNLQYSCKMLAEHENKTINEILDSKIIVVTNYFHLHRSEILAKRIGYKNIAGLGANCEGIKIPHLYVREICAYIKLLMRILITGEPANILE